MSWEAFLTQSTLLLKSKNADVRYREVEKLYHYMDTELKDHSPREISLFVEKLKGSIFEMIDSNDTNEKQGGILASMTLTCSDADYVHLVHVVRKVFFFNEKLIDERLMKLAANAIGRIASAAAPLKAVEYVGWEMGHCSDWLTGDYRKEKESRRYAAVLILQELAINVPTLFFQFSKDFFNYIFNAIRDSKATIQEAAVLALHAGLVVAVQKESQSAELFNKCLLKSEENFDESIGRENHVSREAWCYGSLLVVTDLLRFGNSEFENQQMKMESITLSQPQDGKLSIPSRDGKKPLMIHNWPSQCLPVKFLQESASSVPFIIESHVCRNLLLKEFHNICRTTLRHRNNKNELVRRGMLQIFPRLGALNPAVFAQDYLDEAIGYMLGSIKVHKGLAYQSIGLLACAVKDKIGCHLKKILESITSSLPVIDKPAKRLKIEPASLLCVGLLAQAVGEKLVPEVRKLLGPMFMTGLSPSLTESMMILSQEIPELKKSIQESMLQTLSNVLLPNSGESSVTDSNNSEVITLALRTLSTFDFSGHSLTEFVKRCALHYLSSCNSSIRFEAVNTCAKLLTPQLENSVLNSELPSFVALIIVTDVLKKLLKVALTDPSEDIRLQVIKSLDSRYERHLAQAENLKILFMILHDESFVVREQTLITIGRLGKRNPAYVMPSLRRTLLQILSELEYSGLGQNKEQAAQMLGKLVDAAPQLMHPYIPAIMKSLIPKLSDSVTSPGVTISILEAIGRQARVSGEMMKPWLNQLLLVILDLLQDTSSSAHKREIALHCLAEVIEWTGSVMTPYEEHPNLLDILLNLLRTEQASGLRREALKVLGRLGALDPHRYRENLGQIDLSLKTNILSQSDSKDDGNPLFSDQNLNEMLVTKNISLKDFYPSAAISILIKIMKDPTLFSQHHTDVVRALEFIFRSLHVHCVQYLPRVMPVYIMVIRSSNSNRIPMFRQLGLIVSIVKQHIRPYLPEIFQLIQDYWIHTEELQLSLMLLMEEIVSALGQEFRCHVPSVLPLILRIFVQDQSRERSLTVSVMGTLKKFGANLEEYIHMILPPILKLIDASQVSISVKVAALSTVESLTNSINLCDYASSIVHTILRTIDSNTELHNDCMKCLIALMTQMGVKFEMFVPIVCEAVKSYHISNSNFKILLAKINQGMDVSRATEKLTYPNEAGAVGAGEETTHITPFSLNIDALKKALNMSQVSKDQWVEWLRKLAICLLKASPSPALRACFTLAENYNPISRELFNVAFVSCWTEMDSANQDKLIHSLEHALSQEIPEITQTLLNLTEFMEHCDGGHQPLELSILGDHAMKCRAYAKALHYKEAEYLQTKSTSVLESLIAINNKLQQPEAAKGILQFAKSMNAGMKVEERWYEKLHDWHKALEIYNRKELDHPSNVSYSLGKMRCLAALGEWQKLQTMASKKWGEVEEEDRKQMSKLAAVSSWGLSQWSSMKKYTDMIPQDSFEGSFYRAVLFTHDEEHLSAQKWINSARQALDNELIALAGESYQRAYGAMVNVQILAELEEVMQYQSMVERRAEIKKMWWNRLQGCQRVVEDWQRILQVRSLVLSPQDDIRTWLKYASLCHKSGRPDLSKQIFNTLMGSDGQKEHEISAKTDPNVILAYLKHMWYSPKLKDLSLQTLEEFTVKFGDGSIPKQLLARYYLKLGQWTKHKEGVSEESIPKILNYFKQASDSSPLWYKAWHCWSFMNYETVTHYKQKMDSILKEQDLSPEEHKEQKLKFQKMMDSYSIAAINGFIQSVALSSGNNLQDTLQLLTLWFEHGQSFEVHTALEVAIKKISIETWLQVIPQLIARIDTPNELVGKLVKQLLNDIGKHHPQALIYPLTVASNSSIQRRQFAASALRQQMSEHSQRLVQEAMLVSEELIRVAIIWHELWHEGLEEASRLFFGEKDEKGMFAKLEPLHAMMERGPQTHKEISFNQAYGQDLREARDFCRRYQRLNNQQDLTHAWDLYYNVFRKISKQLSTLSSLELQHVSPNLLQCKDIELPVPGTYDPNLPTIGIRKFQSTLQVIKSKQAPRKLSIFGNNGQEYMFLLKGHEDLRQDERVMQLFGLVNSLLLSNPETWRQNLTIQRYSVIPLSTNSGLIGWVPHCDTLHALIRDFRENKKILLNIEHRIMTKMAPNYEHLMLIQKVEVFEHALEHTKGDDLVQILWIKSPSSEVWFDRRTNYTRSLAVMSMVGYILGLGDRHPSNLMLDRLSGKITHIDFGDCFEVAMTREKFPERIPFRLTRMLVKAMEVSGIAGNYRTTCSWVMNVLQNNKDSLMAVLEAFVYDPLLNWRLLDDHEDVNKKALAIIHRVQDKLTGNDFPLEETLDVDKQVDLLIEQAMSHKNLCQSYIGWCPFW